MVCGTGMCGACRVGYKDGTVLTCIEGPELDGHMVDWNTLLPRLSMYKEEEAISLSCWTTKVGEIIMPLKDRIPMPEQDQN